MFNHIFFNADTEIEQLAVELYGSLGIKGRVREGDSANVLKGIYFAYSVFGVEIKLEYNSYDYDDKYQYMLGISQDFLSSFQADNKIVNIISEIVIELLLSNFSLEIAFEESEDNLRLFNYSDIGRVTIHKSE